MRKHTAQLSILEQKRKEPELISDKGSKSKYQFLANTENRGTLNCTKRTQSAKSNIGNSTHKFVSTNDFKEKKKRMQGEAHRLKDII